MIEAVISLSKYTTTGIHVQKLLSALFTWSILYLYVSFASWTKMLHLFFINCMVITYFWCWFCNHLKWTKGLVDIGNDIWRLIINNLWKRMLLFFASLVGQTNPIKNNFVDYNKQNERVCACVFPWMPIKMIEEFSSSAQSNLG